MIGSLWLTVLVPVIAMPIVYLLGKSLGKNVSWVALVPLLYSFVDLVGLQGTIAANPVGEYFNWLPGIRFGLYADGLSLPIATLIAQQRGYGSEYSEAVRSREQEGIRDILRGLSRLRSQHDRRSTQHKPV